MLAATGIKVLELVDRSENLRQTLQKNTERMRQGLESLGYTLKQGPTPILPVMLGEATRAAQLAESLLQHGIYVIGFSFPVVPQGAARIRLQVSAAHTSAQIEQALQAFAQSGKELGIIS